MSISYNDVPALVKMLGPDLSKYKGKSDKMDAVINEVDAKVAKALSGVASSE